MSLYPTPIPPLQPTQYPSHQIEITQYHTLLSWKNRWQFHHYRLILPASQILWLDIKSSVYIVCSNNVILYYLYSHGVMINPISHTSVGTCISEDWTLINMDEVHTDTDCRLSQRYILIDARAGWHCFSTTVRQYRKKTYTWSLFNRALIYHGSACEPAFNVSLKLYRSPWRSAHLDRWGGGKVKVYV